LANDSEGNFQVNCAI